MSYPIVLKLPKLEIDHAYHVGRLDQMQKPSYEGHALSVSWDPQSWRFIDQSAPLWLLSRPKATFLVADEISEIDRGLVLGWGQRRGIIEIVRKWRLTDRFGIYHFSDTSTSGTRNDHDVVKREEVETLSVTDDASSHENLIRGIGLLAEWCSIVVFAREHGFDGAAQFTRRSSPDIMHPLGCIFELADWQKQQDAPYPKKAPTISYRSDGFREVDLI